MKAAESAIRVIQGSPPIIQLCGNLTSKNVGEIESAFRSLAPPTCECVHLDAGSASDVESACVRALADALHDLQNRGVTVKLTRASRRLRQMLRDSRPGPRCGPAARAAAWSVPQRLTILDLPCIPESVARIRASVADLAAEAPFGSGDVDDIVIAVGEASANAVRYGTRPGERARVRVRCQLHAAGLYVEISDGGRGFDLARLRAPEIGQCQEGGLGIFLMRRAMDEVHYRFDDQGTTVLLVKYLSDRSGAPHSRR